jgi:hypothetical protein
MIIREMIEMAQGRFWLQLAHEPKLNILAQK